MVFWILKKKNRKYFEKSKKIAGEYRKNSRTILEKFEHVGEILYNSIVKVLGV